MKYDSLMPNELYLDRLGAKFLPTLQITLMRICYAAPSSQPDKLVGVYIHDQRPHGFF